MGTLICRVELNKNDGVTITVDNKSGRVKHTIVLDGSSITTQSVSVSNTSKIVQTPNAVSIDCKHFNVKADTIKFTSKMSTSMSSGSSFNIDSGTTMTADAKAMATIKSATVNIKGQGLVKVEGAMIKLQ
ncbi:hypothetical protein [uncultured Shewanella sp.]|uniref:hypothetical protein n=1 Tax=uncultured Shewanella sp. TaxID=173975 RepID=UPI0026363F27|nr:hypothetical protein [uncultured Shewanella sp.]